MYAPILSREAGGGCLNGNGFAGPRRDFGGPASLPVQLSFGWGAFESMPIGVFLVTFSKTLAIYHKNNPEKH